MSQTQTQPPETQEIAVNAEISDMAERPFIGRLTDQPWSEVVKLPSVSVSHSILRPGERTPYHAHTGIQEMHYFLQGAGVMRHGDYTLKAVQGIAIPIQKGVPTSVKNLGKTDMRFLTFASPGFNSQDFSYHQEPEANQTPLEIVTKRDDHEIFPREMRIQYGFGIAHGILKEGLDIGEHYHEGIDQVYFILSGRGGFNVAGLTHIVSPGHFAYMPPGNHHNLQNLGNTQLEYLCLSSPPINIVSPNEEDRKVPGQDHLSLRSLPLS